MVTEVMQPAFYSTGGVVMQDLLFGGCGGMDTRCSSVQWRRCCQCQRLNEAGFPQVRAPRGWMLEKLTRLEVKATMLLCALYMNCSKLRQAPSLLQRSIIFCFNGRLRCRYDEHPEHAARFYTLVPEEFRDKKGVTTKS